MQRLIYVSNSFLFSQFYLHASVKYPFLMTSSPFDGSPYPRTVNGVLGQDQICT